MLQIRLDRAGDQIDVAPPALLGSYLLSRLKGLLERYSCVLRKTPCVRK